MKQSIYEKKEGWTKRKLYIKQVDVIYFPQLNRMSLRPFIVVLYESFTLTRCTWSYNENPFNKVDANMKRALALLTWWKCVIAKAFSIYHLYRYMENEIVQHFWLTIKVINFLLEIMIYYSAIVFENKFLKCNNHKLKKSMSSHSYLYFVKWLFWWTIMEMFLYNRLWS